MAVKIAEQHSAESQQAYFFPFGAAFFACERSEAATVFWLAVDFLLESSFPAFFAGFFPVVMDLFLLPH